MKNSCIVICSLLFISVFIGGCSIVNDNKSIKLKDNSSEKSDLVINSSQEKNDKLEQVQKNEYRKNIENMDLIMPVELQNILDNNEDVYVYFGRETCPSCRSFVAKLNKEILKSSRKIYYIDTEDTKKDKNIQEIRKKYTIKYVPSFLKISSNEQKKYDSRKETLIEFLK